MNSFSEYMDRIKAEEDLKRNTAISVKNALAERAQQPESGKTAAHGVKRPVVKRLAAAVASLAACAVLALAGYKYYYTPVHYVSLDINPSVELGVSRLAKVVSADSYNSDGDLLLKENRLEHLPVDEAVSLLVQEAVRQGFIDDNGSTVIAVTAEADDEEAAAVLHEAGRAGINQALDSSNAKAVIYCGSACLMLREEAKAMGISPGKYKLIAILQQLDPGIKAEDYKDAKITDIITKVNACMLSCPSDALDVEDAECLRIISEAANDVLAAKASGQNKNNACNGNMGSENGQEQNTALDTDACGQSQAGAQSDMKSEQKESNDGDTANQQSMVDQVPDTAQQGKAQSELQQSLSRKSAADKQNQSQNKASATNKQNQSQNQGAEADKQNEGQGHGQSAAADKQNENQGQGAAADKQNESQGQGAAADKQNENQGLGTAADKKNEGQGQGVAADNQSSSQTGQRQDNKHASDPEQKSSNENERENAQGQSDDKGSGGTGSQASNSVKAEKDKE